jgi:predicted enzyme related to lactoylglutathione lyase
MAQERPTTPGRFVWHELTTQNPEASRAFYAELFGWKFDTHDPDYVHITAAGEAVGGMLKAPAPFIPTHWLPYISVDDVDASLQKASAAGCELVAGPMEVDPGRFVILRDPQGAMFTLWRARKGDMPEVAQPALGNFCWDQLDTGEPDAAFALYAQIFGWSRAPSALSRDMTTLMRGERHACSLMKSAVRPARWLSFVVVDDLAAARERARKLGGKVVTERVDVPGVGAFCILQDTLGAVIAAFADSPRA